MHSCRALTSFLSNLCSGCYLTWLVAGDCRCDSTTISLLGSVFFLLLSFSFLLSFHPIVCCCFVFGLLGISSNCCCEANCNSSSSSNSNNKKARAKILYHFHAFGGQFYRRLDGLYIWMSRCCTLQITFNMQMMVKYWWTWLIRWSEVSERELAGHSYVNPLKCSRLATQTHTHTHAEHVCFFCFVVIQCA